MSVLKQIFENEVVVHVMDHSDLFMHFLQRIQGLARIVQEYYYSEVEFENHLYLLALFGYDIRSRLARLLKHCPIKSVQNWRQSVLNYCDYHYDPLGPYARPTDTAHLLIVCFWSLCSRIWCWYRHDENNHTYTRNFGPTGECNCEFSVNRDNLLTHYSAKLQLYSTRLQCRIQ